MWQKTGQCSEDRPRRRRVVSRLCECVHPPGAAGITESTFQSLFLSSSPTRGPLLSQGTGMGASFWSTRNDAATTKVSHQFTGMTTIAKQQTGLGHISASSDPDLLRQLTGGGLSPTRQLGTTGLAKQFTGSSGVRSNFTGSGMTRSYTTALNPTPTGNRPLRPKSAGSRTKSVDESGRGMALMRQLTGGTGSFLSNEV